MDPGAGGELAAAPFDFADQRIEKVPRDQDGQVVEERLRAQMQRRIVALLRDDAG